jgi:hypothetical protein
VERTHGDNATTVRLGNNATAYVDELFFDYPDFENVRDNLVTREPRAAPNAVSADFGPPSPPTAPTSRR